MLVLAVATWSTLMYHTAGFRDWYRSPSVRVVKCNTLRWTGNVAGVKETWNLHRRHFSLNVR